MIGDLARTYIKSKNLGIYIGKNPEDPIDRNIYKKLYESFSLSSITGSYWEDFLKLDKTDKPDYKIGNFVESYSKKIISDLFNKIEGFSKPVSLSLKDSSNTSEYVILENHRGSYDIAKYKHITEIDDIWLYGEKNKQLMLFEFTRVNNKNFDPFRHKRIFKKRENAAKAFGIRTGNVWMCEILPFTGHGLPGLFYKGPRNRKMVVPYPENVQIILDGLSSESRGYSTSSEKLISNFFSDIQNKNLSNE